MISKMVQDILSTFVPEENFHLQEPMNLHTTFRVGGAADCLLQVDNEEQLAKVIKYLNQIELPYFILGNGSNLLVSDQGFPGVMVQIADKMSDIIVEGQTIVAGAGAYMSKVAKAALDNGLTGLEFCSGIPGTVGGGVSMNAGAYDGEMKQVVSQVRALDTSGEILLLDNDTMEFGYRTSVLKMEPLVVTQVTFELQKGNPEAIKAKMDDFATRRREKQPLEYPSAGSTFKRPEGNFAGKLIRDSGLSGFTVGGAQVSEKHCGFVINKGGATARDISELMSQVQHTVYEKYGVQLEPEVIKVGRF